MDGGMEGWREGRAHSAHEDPTHIPTRSMRLSPTSPPARSARSSAAASTAASPKPRLTPWPASGCTACAASPIKAMRGST